MHSNVEPAGVAVNVNDGDVPFVNAGGLLVIVVSNTAAATVNERLAVPAFQAGSVARTVNV